MLPFTISNQQLSMQPIKIMSEVGNIVEILFDNDCNADSMFGLYTATYLIE